MSEQTSNPTSGQNVPKSKFRRKSRQEQTAASKLRMGMCNKIVGKGGWQSNRTENVLFKEKKLSG